MLKERVGLLASFNETGIVDIGIALHCDICCILSNGPNEYKRGIGKVEKNRFKAPKGAICAQNPST